MLGCKGLMKFCVTYKYEREVSSIIPTAVLTLGKIATPKKKKKAKLKKKKKPKKKKKGQKKKNCY